MAVFTTGPHADDQVTPDNEGVSAIELIDPFDLFGRWFEAAKEKEINDPNAMTIATVDDDGMPSARMVLRLTQGTGAARQSGNGPAVLLENAASTGAG